MEQEKMYVERKLLQFYQKNEDLFESLKNNNKKVRRIPNIEINTLDDINSKDKRQYSMDKR